tara:strand:- start:872 stop:1075 length:204 start_codon:yes stop_codon:yes gene_type:complete
MEFIEFQDDFYDLLEKYGIDKINNEHTLINEITILRNTVYDFIENNGDKTDFIIVDGKILNVSTDEL